MIRYGRTRTHRFKSFAACLAMLAPTGANGYETAAYDWIVVVDVYLMLIWTMLWCSCCIDSWSVLLPQIRALFPNSWYRSFCRTRFQKKRGGAAELHDIVFAQKLSSGPVPLALCLFLQQDAHCFGSRLRLDFQPPWECQYESRKICQWKTVSSA